MDYFISNISIKGISAAVPEKIIRNEDIISQDKYAMIQKVIGVDTRHSLLDSKMNIADLAVIASKQVIEKSKIDLSKIKVLCYVTQDPIYANPSTAFYVQKKLGLDKDCIVFDVNYGCSGFVAGLQIASSVLSATIGDDSVALMINAEYLTYKTHVVENEGLIFGDAATCTVLQKTKGIGNIIGTYFSDGERYKTIFRQTHSSPAEMDGDEVFQFSITEVPAMIKEFMQKNKLSYDDIDFFVPHQANKLIVKKMSFKSGFAAEKVLYSLEEYGNTAGASIPLSICNNNDRLKKTTNLLVCGFGIGLAWGCANFQISQDCVSPIIIV